MLLAETAATTPTTLAQKPSRAAGRSVSPAVSPPWEANDAPAHSDPEVSSTPAGFDRPKRDPAGSAAFHQEPTSCTAFNQDSGTTAKRWREWPPLEDVQALISSNARLRARQAADELASLPPAAGDQLAAPLASTWLTWSMELERLRRHCHSAEAAVSEAERHIDAEESSWRQRTVAHREECAAIREAAARREAALLRRVAELEQERAARDGELAAVHQDVAEFSARASRVIRSLRERVELQELGATGAKPSVCDDVGDDDSVAAVQHELEQRAAVRSSGFSEPVSAFSLEASELAGGVPDCNLSVSNFFHSIDSCNKAAADDVSQHTTISSVGNVSDSASSSGFARSVENLDTMVGQLEADITRITQLRQLKLFEEMQKLCAEEQRLEQLEASLNRRAQELDNATSQPGSKLATENMPSFEKVQDHVTRLRERISELHGIRASRAQLEDSAAAQESELRQLRSEQDELFEFAYREGLLDLSMPAVLPRGHQNTTWLGAEQF